MKILQVHNKYRNPGGEDTVIEAECLLLKSRGHEVYQWFESSTEIKGYGWWKQFILMVSFFWSFTSYQRMKRWIRRVQPDIVHVHNTVPLVTPSIYYACKKMNIPVIQTLHNYRLSCANGLLFRKGKVCEKCITHKNPFYAFKYVCYRDSKSQSLIMSTHLWLHRKLGTYQKYISSYIALTAFAKQKNVLSGLPEEKIIVKPNFLPYGGKTNLHTKSFALFVGRLVEEKGVNTLLKAWEDIGSNLPLKIIGGGPLEERIKNILPESVIFLGHKNREFILEEMRKAKVLIFPSEWYEGFPMTLLEAFSVGLPVIASKLGGPQEIVNKNLGWTFEPGSPQDLTSKVYEMLTLNNSEYLSMSRRITQYYQEHYSEDANYEMLINIYQQAIENKKELSTKN
jgi:glycosyltransferase involved in cell wall biosynthesis